MLDIKAFDQSTGRTVCAASGGPQDRRASTTGAVGLFAQAVHTPRLALRSREGGAGGWRQTAGLRGAEDLCLLHPRETRGNPTLGAGAAALVRHKGALGVRHALGLHPWGIQDTDALALDAGGPVGPLLARAAGHGLVNDTLAADLGAPLGLGHGHGRVAAPAKAAPACGPADRAIRVRPARPATIELWQKVGRPGPDSRQDGQRPGSVGCRVAMLDVGRLDRWLPTGTGHAADADQQYTRKTLDELHVQTPSSRRPGHSQGDRPGAGNRVSRESNSVLCVQP